jgi:hypothetical protein
LAIIASWCDCDLKALHSIGHLPGVPAVSSRGPGVTRCWQYCLGVSIPGAVRIAAPTTAISTTPAGPGDAIRCAHSGRLGSGRGNHDQRHSEQCDDRIERCRRLDIRSGYQKLAQRKS